MSNRPFSLITSNQNLEVFGPYPELLKPYLNEPKYLLKYHNDKIVGREEV
jgi:hypothetical protein